MSALVPHPIRMIRRTGYDAAARTVSRHEKWRPRPRPHSPRRSRGSQTRVSRWREASFTRVKLAPTTCGPRAETPRIDFGRCGFATAPEDPRPKSRHGGTHAHCFKRLVVWFDPVVHHLGGDRLLAGPRCRSKRAQLSRLLRLQLDLLPCVTARGLHGSGSDGLGLRLLRSSRTTTTSDSEMVTA